MITLNIVKILKIYQKTTDKACFNFKSVNNTHYFTVFKIFAKQQYTNRCGICKLASKGIIDKMSELQQLLCHFT